MPTTQGNTFTPGEVDALRDSGIEVGTQAQLLPKRSKVRKSLERIRTEFEAIADEAGKSQRSS